MPWKVYSIGHTACLNNKQRLTPIKKILFLFRWISNKKIHMSKYNRIPNQPKNKKVIIRVTESEKNHINRLAYQQNKTISRVLLESVKAKWQVSDYDTSMKKTS